MADEPKRSNAEQAARLTALATAMHTPTGDVWMAEVQELLLDVASRLRSPSAPADDGDAGELMEQMHIRIKHLTAELARYKRQHELDLAAARSLRPEANSVGDMAVVIAAELSSLKAERGVPWGLVEKVIGGILSSCDINSHHLRQIHRKELCEEILGKLLSAW
ncbi:MAG TPA: hypothetical protein PKA76_19530 [Pirellulaceae bacterium]|nr:hypothetical protein [Pirellulaceae bacterium]